MYRIQIPLALITAILSLLLVAPAFAQTTVLLTSAADSRGNDIDVLSNTNLNACKAKCLANSRCVTFTYRTREKKCWLKDKFNSWISWNYQITKYRYTTKGGTKTNGNSNGYSSDDNGVYMGVKLTSAQRNKLRTLDRNTRDGMDRPGADYRQIHTGNTSKKFFPLCKQICATDPKCQSVAMGNGKCYLKRSSPRPKSKSSVISASANPGNKA